MNARISRLAGATIRLVGIALLRRIYRVQVVGVEKFPMSGGLLLLPNHVTYADAFFISAACPRRVRFVMDEAFMASRAIRCFVKIFETVTIRRDRPREAIRITIEAVKSGDVVCLFPEGQLTRTGVLCALRRGFELIANKAGHPLYPLWCDGSWASVFAFPRRRKFREVFAQRPEGLVIAIGEKILPEGATLRSVRQGLHVASAAAIERRFSDRKWQARVPAGAAESVARFRALGVEERRRLWVNGYQIGQINALRPAGELRILHSDLAGSGLLSLCLTFPALFGVRLLRFDRFDGSEAGVWAGGESLRARIQGEDACEEIVFYDFSGMVASAPLEVPGLLHLPCLAVEGVLVSMSMQDPAPPVELGERQHGRREGSFGKLLPGWYLEPQGFEDGVRVHGPAAPPGGLLLPAGYGADEEGFLVPML
jgi:acyl-[acyl-carrier-protein]-phospholipid O-acyltransferase/long-chain-fatty-acid--[acyl-carrier-protein] ligase